MADYARNVKKILIENGCFFVGQGKGDHSIWHSPISDHTFPVDGKIKLKHTANGIFKEAGINYRF
ncbi:MAG: type II toxin-antitoxin system HicA family toxin [Lachnospiraceae bacterium]|nr:type II toxin-antitoxin system HicA family toxin [Lachnospiraceae bacterium]